MRGGEGQVAEGKRERGEKEGEEKERGHTRPFKYVDVDTQDTTVVPEGLWLSHAITKECKVISHTTTLKHSFPSARLVIVFSHAPQIPSLAPRLHYRHREHCLACTQQLLCHHPRLPFQIPQTLPYTHTHVFLQQFLSSLYHQKPTCITQGLDPYR